MSKIIKIVLISIILLIITVIIFIKYVLSKDNFDFISRNYADIGTFIFDRELDKTSRNIDVLKYDIALKISVEQKTINETAKLLIVKDKKDTNDIELDLYDDFNIVSVKLNNNKAKYVYKNNVIKIDRKNIPEDTLFVEIQFNGKPQNLGFGSFNIEEVNGNIFISTLNEPFYAHTWFPCNDTPADKALCRLTVTTDSSLTTVSNGKLLRVAKEGSQNTYYWETNYPIATYLITFYSGNYVHFNQEFVDVNDSMNIDYYVTKNKIEEAKKDFSEHPYYLKILTELFGEYPFIKEKYGVAEIPWKSGAMESQTITGIGSNYISGMRFYESMLIHELAHHWWGNSVTPVLWNDVWLNEGFATYTEALYYEKVSGKDALISTMHSFASSIDKESRNTLYNPGVNLFSSNVYNKGAWVLHMLRKEVGDSLFFNGLKLYYKKYAYGNASTDDLKNFFERLTNKNLEKFFNEWVFEGSGILELNIEWMEKTNSEGTNILKIDLEQTQDGYKNYEYTIDIEVKDSLNNIYSYSPVISGDTSLRFPLKSNVKRISFDKDNWLLAILNY